MDNLLSCGRENWPGRRDETRSRPFNLPLRRRWRWKPLPSPERPPNAHFSAGVSSTFLPKIVSRPSTILMDEGFPGWSSVNVAKVSQSSRCRGERVPIRSARLAQLTHAVASRHQHRVVSNHSDRDARNLPPAKDLVDEALDSRRQLADLLRHGRLRDDEAPRTNDARHTKSMEPPK